VPVHAANSANARLPAVSRLVTRIPSVRSRCQCSPPSWVTHSCGPNAQPSSKFRNLTWLTPLGPRGAPVTGAGTPYQLLP
jgi:hypothetical protein